MQLRYLASELGNGFRRNISMTVAVILTMAISLTLVGAGWLMKAQVGEISQALGSQLEVKIVFCGNFSSADQCVAGAATSEQEDAVEKTLDDSPYVSEFRYETRDEAYDNFKAQYADSGTQEEKIFETLKLTPDDMSSSYWATLAHPNDNDELLSEVQNMPGVDSVVDLRDRLSKVYDILGVLRYLAFGGAIALVLAAILQVANTIRLAAMARRREIGIMRLVGASNLYIQLPFLLEILLSCLIGAALACGSIVLTMAFAVPWLRQHVTVWPWVQWSDAYVAMGLIVGIAFLLGTIPTLLMTRKYLKV